MGENEEEVWLVLHRNAVVCSTCKGLEMLCQARVAMDALFCLYSQSSVNYISPRERFGEDFTECICCHIVTCLWADTILNSVALSISGCFAISLQVLLLDLQRVTSLGQC